MLEMFKSSGARKPGARAEADSGKGAH
jgi:hypothetical protein